MKQSKRKKHGLHTAIRFLVPAIVSMAVILAASGYETASGTMPDGGDGLPTGDLPQTLSQEAKTPATAAEPEPFDESEAPDEPTSPAATESPEHTEPPDATEPPEHAEPPDATESPEHTEPPDATEFPPMSTPEKNPDFPGGTEDGGASTPPPDEAPDGKESTAPPEENNAAEETSSMPENTPSASLTQAPEEVPSPSPVPLPMPEPSASLPPENEAAEGEATSHSDAPRPIISLGEMAMPSALPGDTILFALSVDVLYGQTRYLSNLDARRFETAYAPENGPDVYDQSLGTFLSVVTASLSENQSDEFPLDISAMLTQKDIVREGVNNGYATLENLRVLEDASPGVYAINVTIRWRENGPEAEEDVFVTSVFFEVLAPLEASSDEGLDANIENNLEAGSVRLDVPAVLAFQTVDLSDEDQIIAREETGWALRVFDSRGDGNSVSVYVRLEAPLASAAGEVLEGGLVFAKDGVIMPLAQQNDTLVATVETRTGIESYTIQWEEEEGFLIRLPGNTGKAGETYTVNIIWTLIEGPSTEDAAPEKTGAASS